MSEDYRGVWQNLGLDLAAYDAPLVVLGLDALLASRVFFLRQPAALHGFGQHDLR